MPSAPILVSEKQKNLVENLLGEKQGQRRALQCLYYSDKIMLWSG